MGPMETLFPEGPIDRLWAPGNQTKGDFRTIAVKPLPQEASVFFLQGNDAPWGGIPDHFQVIAKHPGMSFTEPGETL